MSNVLDQAVDLFEPAPELVSMMTGAELKLPVLLALDIGTSGTRAAIFDERGAEIQDTGVQVTRLARSATDFSTWDADELRLQVVQAIDATLFEARFLEATSRIRLIAVSCFWHSLVGIDQDGNPTTPVLGWADNRAVAEVSELRSRLNEAEFHSRTGCRLHPSYWPAKILRLRNQEPDVFRRTTKWLSFAEYLALEVFGETAASVSMASGTGIFNQRTCEWDQQMLDALNIGIESLPEIALPRKTFQRLMPEYAERWPQLSEARMFPAIGDGAANSIGAGCTSKEKAALMIGTSGAMRVLYAGEPPVAVPPELWSYRADRDRVVIGGALSDGGGLYHWFRESLLGDQDAEAIEMKLSRLAPDSHGLTILPFWAGERSTGWHADARGAIIGLNAQTRPIEILRAAMEAVAYRFALIAKALEPIAPGSAIVASGNALRSSRVWGQILADVLGRRVTLCEESEASLRGAALLALEAAGKIQSIAEFSVPAETVFEPRMSHHERYQQALDRQQQIYERVIKNS
ncbi:MAG TPA: gluconokinase [Pyrinomonadaceae bacterium]|nr:gluconokinase [Pyrinomonadaceae bacterium]